MFRLMEAAESLSTAEWKLLTEVLLLGLAESGIQNTLLHRNSMALGVTTSKD